MLNNLTGWHFALLVVVVLLMFGAPRLPALARSLGQSVRILKSEAHDDVTLGRDAPDGRGALETVPAPPAPAPHLHANGPLA